MSKCWGRDYVVTEHRDLQVRSSNNLLTYQVFTTYHISTQ